MLDKRPLSGVCIKWCSFAVVYSSPCDAQPWLFASVVHVCLVICVVVVLVIALLLCLSIACS